MEFSFENVLWLRFDEIVTSSATSNTSKDSKQVNVLTQDQEFILEAIKRLDDSQLQKTYLDKLVKDFSKPEHLPSNPPNRSILPSTSTNTYDLTKILNKKKSKTIYIYIYIKKHSRVSVGFPRVDPLDRPGFTGPNSWPVFSSTRPGIAGSQSGFPGLTHRIDRVLPDQIPDRFFINPTRFQPRVSQVDPPGRAGL